MERLRFNSKFFTKSFCIMEDHMSFSPNFDKVVSGFKDDTTQFHVQENKPNKSAKHNVIVLKAKSGATDKLSRAGKGVFMLIATVLSVCGPVFTQAGRTLLATHWDHVVRGKRIVIDEKMGDVDQVRAFLGTQKQGDKGLVSLQAIKDVGAYMAVQRGEEGILVNAQCQQVIDPAIKAGYEVRPSPMKGEDPGSPSKVYLVKPFNQISSFNELELQTWVDPKVPPSALKMPLAEALQQAEGNSGELMGVNIKPVPVEELHQVTDPNEICVASQSLVCSNREVTVELDCAVAMRKGSTKELSTPKAMGEDAFVLDVVTINCRGQNYQIPITATLDGGGGHTFAQYGREKLKETFERHLTRLVEQNDHIDSAIIAAAMRYADDELFAKFPAPGRAAYSGTAYDQLKANHKKVEKDLKIQVDQFKGAFQRLHMNPLDYHRSLPPGEHLLTIGKKKFNLGDKQVAEKLQMYYELATGSQNLIDVQNVMNAFFVNVEGQLECVTYNRGDSMALFSQGETTQALSERVLPTKTNRSCVQLQGGARVVSVCDGVTDVLTINELEDANKNLKLKNKGSEEYVTTLMKASILNGSGDDKTILSVRVKASSKDNI